MASREREDSTALCADVQKAVPSVESPQVFVVTRPAQRGNPTQQVVRHSNVRP